MTLDFSHIESKKSYYEFYKKVGKLSPKDQQVVIKRISSFLPYLESPIIELGCSSAFNLILFAELGFSSLVGVDCSPTYIKKAKKRIKKNSQITLVESFIEDLPEDKKYNTIVLTEVLEHVINVHPILEKCKKLLNENGYIFITSPSERCGSNGHIRGINKKEIVKLLKEHNLKVYKWFQDFQWIIPNYPSTIRLIAQHD